MSQDTAIQRQEESMTINNNKHKSRFPNLDGHPRRFCPFAGFALRLPWKPPRKPAFCRRSDGILSSIEQTL
jgi:hypothetical protein